MCRYWSTTVCSRRQCMAHRIPTAVGVDRGVVVAVATSGGDLLDQVFTTPAEKRRALRLQRKLSRAAKHSANRIKARQRHARLRAKDARRRQDFCVKTARHLACKNAVVVLEKLPTRNMTRRAKPAEDPSNPGHWLPNGAASKSGLNKAILSKGWYRFERALKSASRYTGARRVGMWTRNPVRAKRFSGAPAARIRPSTQM
jgi:putative transposase